MKPNGSVLRIGDILIKTEPLMKYERLNVKLALDLIKNQTQADEVMILMGGDSLEFVANHYHTKSPTWVRIDNNEQVKSYQWQSNQMEQVIGTLNIKQLKDVFSSTKEKDIEMWVEPSTVAMDGKTTYELHFKYGFITKTMKITPLWEDEVWWDFEYAKQQHEDDPEIVDSMVGCLDPKTLNWFKGALIESTELRGNLWRCFKGLRLLRNDIEPVYIDYNGETLTMKWPKNDPRSNSMSAIDCITVSFDVDEIEKPWKGKTTNGYFGTSKLIDNLGRLGKGVLAKGKMELTVWEHALEFNLAIQRTKDSRKVHFRTFIPLNVNRS